MTTRKSTEIYLVGQPLSSFGVRLLPTAKEVVRRVLSLGENSQENRKTVIAEVLGL